ncbi:Protein OS-9 homolog [Linum perenne]
MPDKNGHRYLCYLPKIEKAKSGKPVSQLNMSSMIMETEKRVKLKTPDELLEVLKDRCFIRVSIAFQVQMTNHYASSCN